MIHNISQYDYKGLSDLTFKLPVLCEECYYLRKCRACYRCAHPNGLKEPKPEQGTFCCYGIKTGNEVISNEDQTD